MITEQILREQIANLQKQHEEGFAKMHQAHGAIMFAEFLLGVMDEMKNKSPMKEPEAQDPNVIPVNKSSPGAA